MDIDSKVKLAEIGGDIKRIFDFITQQRNDVVRIDQRLNHHGERLTSLETARHVQDGQAQGIAKTVKIMWALVGGSGGVILAGLAAIIARAKGL